MAIEQQDIALNNEEGVEEVETQEEETTEAPAEERKEYKPSETPEARLARLDRQAAQLRKKLGLDTEKPSTKSNDLDYGQKAFLAANGIKGTREMDFVRQEMKVSGMDIESLLENDYFQAKLEKQRALAKTADATPHGKRSSGVPTDSVEYWATKPIEEVPQDMRIKVVNARLAKEKSKGVFYNS